MKSMLCQCVLFDKKFVLPVIYLPSLCAWVGQRDRVLELQGSTRQSAFAPAAVCQLCSSVSWGDLSVDFVSVFVRVCVRVCHWPEGDWNQVMATSLRYVSQKLLPCLLPPRVKLLPMLGWPSPRRFTSNPRCSTFISTNFYSLLAWNARWNIS